MSKDSKTPKKKGKKTEEVITKSDDVIIAISPSAIYGFNEALEAAKNGQPFDLPCHPNYAQPRDEPSQEVVDSVYTAERIYVPLTLFTDPETGVIGLADGRNRLTGAGKWLAEHEDNPEGIFTSIPCRMMPEGTTASEIRAYMVQANVDRANLTEIETANAVCRLIDDEQLEETEVLALFGKKGKQGVRWLNTIRSIVSNPVLTKSVAAGDIDMKTASAIASVTDDEEETKKKIDDVVKEKRKLAKEGKVPAQHIESAARVNAGVATPKKAKALAGPEVMKTLVDRYAEFIRFSTNLESPAYEETAEGYDDAEGCAPDLLTAIQNDEFAIRGEITNGEAACIDLDSCTMEDARAFFANVATKSLLMGQIIALALVLKCKSAVNGVEDFDAILAWVRSNVPEEFRKKGKLFVAEQQFWGVELMAAHAPKEKKKKKADKPKKAEKPEKAKKDKPAKEAKADKPKDAAEAPKKKKKKAAK